MIQIRSLTIKKVLDMTQDDITRENTATLRELRKWCGQQMERMSKVIDASEESETIKILRVQKQKLNQVRIQIDQINGVSSEKIASRNTGIIKAW